MFLLYKLLLSFVNAIATVYLNSRWRSSSLEVSKQLTTFEHNEASQQKRPENPLNTDRDTIICAVYHDSVMKEERRVEESKIIHARLHFLPDA